MNSIHNFILDLRRKQGAIWIQNQKIKLSLPATSQTHQIDEFISANRSEIIRLLSENSIVSKEEFKRRLILKDTSLPAFPLSFAAEGIWFVEHFERGTSAYNVPSLFEILNPADVEAIKFAIRQLVLRHEILRTTIQMDTHGQGVQVVGVDPLRINEEHVTDKTNLELSISADIHRPFDLQTEYPLRVKFYVMPSDSIGNKQIFLLINFHHIATDGWSAKIFEKELADYFNAYKLGNDQYSLPPLEIQYKDYSFWQQNRLTGVELDEQLAYWRKSLEGYQALELPTDYPRRSKTDYKGSRQVFSFNKDTSDKIRQLVRQYAVTSQSLFLGSLSILLGKYCGQDDVTVRSPIANRHYRQTEGLMGCFVNTLVNRTTLRENQSFVELLHRIHQNQISAQRFQDLPFERLINELSRHNLALFPVLLAVQGSGELQGVDALKNVLNPFVLHTAHEPARVDLAIYVNDTDELISGAAVYATSLFHDNTIKQFIHNYQQLLGILIEHPLKRYGEIALLDPYGCEQLTNHGKGAIKDYPRDKTIYKLFQEQVSRTPDATAIVFENNYLTYHELNEKSNQLARYIRAQHQWKTGHQLTCDTLIGLYIDRSMEMIVGILAIMKAGGAYFPLDINYPRERVTYIVEDTRAQFVLTKRKMSSDLAVDVIYIDLQEELYQQADVSDLTEYSHATDLAYVIYTSGTTGKPKGVMVEHASLVNLVYGQRDSFEVNPGTKALQFAALVFDASISEIFTALTFGSTLFIASNAVRQDASLLVDYLDRNMISLATIPPALLSAMPYRNLTNLKVLVVAGELCTQPVIERWSAGRKLINAYGPTENTVCTSMHTWQTEDSNATIGKPLDNTSIFVLDKYLNPVPRGVRGELYVSGISLARGYLNNIELTNDRFVVKDFEYLQQHVTRLYKTGDQVRWLANGNLEFYGRTDTQVKIRGHRIELQEIENALLNINGIKECCVLARDRKTSEGTMKYLVAYYTLNESSEKPLTTGTLEHLSHILPGYMMSVTNRTFPSKETIDRQLKLTLPDYMVPEALVMIESIPVTINGKIDKNALPEPRLELVDDFIAPATEREEMLCMIWQEILGRKQVGMTDDFFRIGGNSILAIQASHRISKALGYDVKVADIFKFKTLADLQQLSMTDQSSVNDSGEHWELIV